MSQSTLPDHLLEVFAAQFAGVSTGDDLVEWATKALELGFNTRSLRILAGLPTPISETDAEPLFLASLKELGIEVPTVESLWRPYLIWICNMVEHGTVSPDEAANLIHSRVVSPLGHPKELERWCRVWEGYRPDDTFTPVEGEERDQLIREMARDELRSRARAPGYY